MAMGNRHGADALEEDWRLAFGAALVAAALAGAAAYTTGFLTGRGAAIETGIAALLGWALTTIAKDPGHRRPASAVAVVAVLAGSLVARETWVIGDGFVGGCGPFTVYAQNRWRPVGAKARERPTANARDTRLFGPNELIPVDGWVRGGVAYPTNHPPWDSDVWFHLVDDQGWVSFSAVRADPTNFDPTGFDPEGGRPVPLDPDCGGTIRDPAGGS